MSRWGAWSACAIGSAIGFMWGFDERGYTLFLGGMTTMSIAFTVHWLANR